MSHPSPVRCAASALAARRLTDWVARVDDAPDDNGEIPTTLFTRRLPISRADLARGSA